MFQIEMRYLKVRDFYHKGIEAHSIMPMKIARNEPAVGASKITSRY